MQINPTHYGVKLHNFCASGDVTAGVLVGIAGGKHSRWSSLNYPAGAPRLEIAALGATFLATIAVGFILCRNEIRTAVLRYLGLLRVEKATYYYLIIIV